MLFGGVFIIIWHGSPPPKDLIVLQICPASWSLLSATKLWRLHKPLFQGTSLLVTWSKYHTFRLLTKTPYGISEFSSFSAFCKARGNSRQSIIPAHPLMRSWRPFFRCISRYHMEYITFKVFLLFNSPTCFLKSLVQWRNCESWCHLFCLSHWSNKGIETKLILLFVLQPMLLYGGSMT